MNEIVNEHYYWQNDLVRLRAWQEEDWKWDYHNGFDSPAERLGAHNISLPPTETQSKDYSMSVADFRINYDKIVFAIETLEGIHVGRISILLDDYKNGIFGLGVRVANEHQKKGYGTSAMKILMKYAFMEKRLNKYSGSVLEGNEAAIHMHKNLGCNQEGVFKQHVYTEGKYLDEIYFGLTKDDYMTKRNDSI